MEKELDLDQSLKLLLRSDDFTLDHSNILNYNLVFVRNSVIDNGARLNREQLHRVEAAVNRLVEGMVNSSIHRLSHFHILKLEMLLDVLLTHNKYVSIRFMQGRYVIFSTFINILNRFAADSIAIQDSIERCMKLLGKCRLINHTTNDHVEAITIADLIDPRVIAFAANKHNIGLIAKFVSGFNLCIMNKAFENDYRNMYSAPRNTQYGTIGDPALYESLQSLYCNPETVIDLYVMSMNMFDYINEWRSITTAQPPSMNKLLRFLGSVEPYFAKKHPNIQYLYDILKLTGIDLIKREPMNETE